MLPFHKGDRITTTAGGAKLLGFSAAVKGSMVDAPEAPRPRLTRIFHWISSLRVYWTRSEGYFHDYAAGE